MVYFANLFNFGIHFVEDSHDECGNIIPFNTWNQRGLPHTEFLKWYSIINMVSKLKPGIVKDVKRIPEEITLYYNDNYLKINSVNSKKIYNCIRDSIFHTKLNKPKVWLFLEELNKLKKM